MIARSSIDEPGRKSHESQSARLPSALPQLPYETEPGTGKACRRCIFRSLGESDETTDGASTLLNIQDERVGNTCHYLASSSIHLGTLAPAQTKDSAAPILPGQVEGEFASAQQSDLSTAAIADTEANNEKQVIRANDNRTSAGTLSQSHPHK